MLTPAWDLLYASMQAEYVDWAASRLEREKFTLKCNYKYNVRSDIDLPRIPATQHHEEADEKKQ